MVSRILFYFIFSFLGPVQAQEFAPPRPPPLDPSMDFEDMEDEMIEIGDEGSRPPTLGNAGSGPATLPAPSPFNSQDSRSSFGFGSTGFLGKDAKVRFYLVDDYWEKGKKRSRGKKSPEK